MNGNGELAVLDDVPGGIRNLVDHYLPSDEKRRRIRLLRWKLSDKRFWQGLL
jgi:hypothetical protein